MHAYLRRLAFLACILLGALARAGCESPTIPPAGFPWPAIWNFSVLETRTTFEPISLRPSGKAYYVATTGNDAAAGTAAAPLRSVYAAVRKSDAVEVWIAAGEYGLGDAGATPHGSFGSVSKTILLTRWGAGTVILSTRLQDLTWAADGGAYKVTVTGTIATAWDSVALDADGLPVRLTLGASAVAVQATPGTYYKDGSNVLWLHTSDSRAPDTDVAVYTTGDTWESDTAATAWVQYMEHITFHGSGPAIRGAGVTLVMSDCSVRYAATGQDGIRIQAGAAAYLVDVTAEANGNDGIKLNTSGGNTPLLMERVVSRFNGWSDSTLGNGYSRHTGGVTLGVGCTFNGNGGPNVHDIGTSTTWLVNCTATDPRGTGGNDINYAMSYGSAGTSTMWLYRCTSGTGASNGELAAGATGTIWHRWLSWGQTVLGAGTIGTY